MSNLSAYRQAGGPLHLALCIQKQHETNREYLTRWSELRFTCEGVTEAEAIRYFADGCWDGTLLKHKLMCKNFQTVAETIAIADK